MTEQQRPPNEVTPTSPETRPVDEASRSAVRASPTQEAPAGGNVAAPLPATPFERAPAAGPPVGGDGVLPFVRPAPAVSPALQPAAPVAEPEAVVPAALPMTAAPVATPEAVVPAASPVSPTPAAAPEAPAATAAAGISDGPSPWHREEKLDASLLPSANLEFLPSATAAPAAEPKPATATLAKLTERVHRSRTAFYVGVGVAVVLMVGAIIYFATHPPGGSNDPTSVGVGADGEELGPEPEDTESPAAAASGSGSASAGATRRVWRPRKPPAKKEPGRYVPDDL